MNKKNKINEAPSLSWLVSALNEARRLNEDDYFEREPQVEDRLPKLQEFLKAWAQEYSGGAQAAVTNGNGSEVRVNQFPRFDTKTLSKEVYDSMREEFIAIGHDLIEELRRNDFPGYYIASASPNGVVLVNDTPLNEAKKLNESSRAISVLSSVEPHLRSAFGSHYKVRLHAEMDEPELVVYCDIQSEDAEFEHEGFEGEGLAIAKVTVFYEDGELVAYPNVNTDRSDRDEESASFDPRDIKGLVDFISDFFDHVL